MKPYLVIQNWAPERGAAITDYFDEQSIPYRRVRLYEGERLPDHHAVEAAICLGTIESVSRYQEADQTKQLYRWTAEAIRLDMPYLGICYGSQLVARILGAAVMPHHEAEIGIYTARLTEAGKSDPLFEGIDPEFPVLQMHEETFKLPFGATQLVEADGCPNQAFRRGRAVAIQFHLDLTADDVAAMTDAHPLGLSAHGVKREDLLAAVDEHADRLDDLNRQLLDNFMRE